MTEQKKERPEEATDEVLNYLDDLRESGETNMMGAGTYVQRKFYLDRREAREVVLYWMHRTEHPELYRE